MKIPGEEVKETVNIKHTVIGNGIFGVETVIFAIGVVRAALEFTFTSVNVFKSKPRVYLLCIENYHFFE